LGFIFKILDYVGFLFNGVYSYFSLAVLQCPIVRIMFCVYLILIFLYKSLTVWFNKMYTLCNIYLLTVQQINI